MVVGVLTSGLGLSMHLLLVLQVVLLVVLRLRLLVC
jgi:hypothetical protein